MRYFMFLSYDGTAYHGWQVQPNADSVQQRINRALTLLLGAPTTCVGAGRTDTGGVFRIARGRRIVKWY